MKTRFRRLATTSWFLIIAASISANAGDSGKMVMEPIAAPEPWDYCKLFDYATLYSDKENPFVQKFAFTGRAQADAAFFDGGAGTTEYEKFLWRRLRAGFKSQVFQDFTLHAEANLDANDLDNFYDGLTDVYVGWKLNDAFGIKVGKQGASFTLDGSTSSKELITMERSLLSENLWFPVEYYTGITVGGDLGKFYYNTGFFSSEDAPEFSNFNAGYFGLVSVGYHCAEALGLDKADVRADYVYNEPNSNNGTRSLEQVVSLNGVFEKGKIGVRTDVAGGIGYGSQSDLFGIQLTPYYSITDKLQLVASYGYVNSSGDNGTRLDRYESRTTSGRSNEINEFYAGVNYFFCGHKLKWQTGVEYTDANDNANDGGAYNGWGVTTGIRMSW